MHKARQYNIGIEVMPGIKKVLAEIREVEHSKKSDGDKNKQPTTIKHPLMDCMLCYKSSEVAAGATLKSAKASMIVREWSIGTGH